VRDVKCDVLGKDGIEAVDEECAARTNCALPTMRYNAAQVASVLGGLGYSVGVRYGNTFLQYRPGLIDTTRDLLPVIVKDAARPHLHYVNGSVGLPWASFSGDFAARCAICVAGHDDRKYYEYFNDRRPYALPAWSGALISKPAAFGLNNGWAKYRQVDKGHLPKYQKGEF
jgi:hypothetical protein